AGGEQISRLSAVEERFGDVRQAQSGVTDTIDQIKQRVADSETAVAEQVSEVKQLLGRTESALIGQISEVKQQLGTVESAVADQIREVRSGVTAQQKDVEARIVSSEQSLESQSDSFRGEFSALTDSIGEVKNELGTSVEQWSLREVEHLMVMANERLQLGRDPELARQALQIADKRLQEIDNPALLETRSALSGEIAALSELKEVDIAAVTNSLMLLSNTISDLPLLGIGDTTGPEKIQAADSAEETSDPASDQSTGDKVMSIGRSFLADLGSLVQVEKNGKPVAPSITPEIRQLILAKGRLMLEGAQVALLRRQKGVYLARLEATASWVGEHFDTSNDQTASWLEQLTSLEQFSPEVDYPDISSSLASLRSVIGSEG
ncbi:MAG: uroporphyrinogen-III C-methyltransferase, partial [bacterium]